jgi:hypothetical protein
MYIFSSKIVGTEAAPDPDVINSTRRKQKKVGTQQHQSARSLNHNKYGSHHLRTPLLKPHVSNKYGDDISTPHLPRSRSYLSRSRSQIPRSLRTTRRRRQSPTPRAPVPPLWPHCSRRISLHTAHDATMVVQSAMGGFGGHNCVSVQDHVRGE